MLCSHSQPKQHRDCGQWQNVWNGCLFLHVKGASGSLYSDILSLSKSNQSSPPSASYFSKDQKKKKNLQRFLHILGHKRNSLSQGEGIYPVRVSLHWHYITKVTKDWCAWGVKHILEYNLVPLNNHYEQKDTEQDLFLQICIWPVLVLLCKFQPQVEGKNGSSLDGSFFKCVTCMCHSIGGNPPGKDQT